jgi:hypothetical protein
MERKYLVLVSALTISGLALSACSSAVDPTEEPTQSPVEEPSDPQPTENIEPTERPEPTQEVWTAPDGALIAVPIDEAPVLDGRADESFWAEAPPLTVSVSGGSNVGSSEVTLQSAYLDDSVYFLVSWDDPTQSYLRSPWEKQEDGSWIQLADPDNRGGDNNLWYEDKLAFIWPINSSIPDFESLGCFTGCHAGENSDVKPYGNKYTAEDGQLADIWHWKSVRNVAQVDDQFLDSVRYSPDTPGAGRHGDPKDGGGYVNNSIEDGSLPAYMLPEGLKFDESLVHILDADKVPFDDSFFSPGDRIPGVYTAPFLGDRGDISAGWVYADGMWSVEIARNLVTGSEFDVQFDDLEAPYYFGVAVFDNAQVRHAYQAGANPFVFQP